MTPSAFALFVDVMGIQQQLVGDFTDEEALRRFTRCREQFEHFQRDLDTTIERDLPLVLAHSPTLPQPTFVAEFSDSAYVVGEHFGSVAAAGILLMRKALRHHYPLRGGIGIGSFSHEASGVRTRRDGQTWSTSSFFGGALVTAYQAEQHRARGLRIFVHTAVMRKASEPFLDLCTVPLDETEAGETGTHELRVWQAGEAPAAFEKLSEFQKGQDLTERARAHYERTAAAYKKFQAVEAQLPFAPPALWLFS